MVTENGKDYIYLIWKHPESRRQYVIGELIKNGGYEFRYGMDIEDALNNDFELLIPFQEINKTYFNDILFPVFSSRLPDRKRQDMDDILAKYYLSEYDAYELLKRGGAKLPIDNFEFIDPILSLDDGDIEREFFLAGPRHYLDCKGDDCEKAKLLSKEDLLKFQLEDTNAHDANAIKILDKDNEHIGYLPRYYCEIVRSAMDQNKKIECKVLEVTNEKNCNECVKLLLKIH